MRFLPLALLSILSTAAGDEVILRGGGQLHGDVQQLDSRAGGGYRVVTPTGATLRLDRDQVEQVVTPSAEARQYVARARAAPDTVEGQLALANWCREHNLNAEERRHAERVIELDPSNAEARQMLSFRKVDGEWKTREQVMAERGLVMFEGKYRTRQEVALLEQQEQQKQLEAELASDIRQWRRWLDDRRPERVREAVANFEQVDQPLAGPTIVELLADEENTQVRRLLASAAARIDHQSTVNALVLMSLHDRNEDLRLSCVEWLIKAGRPGLTEAYVPALKSNDNVIVNRAAVALAMLDDPTAIGPLIDALETRHKQTVGNSGGGGDTYSFNTQTGGFSFGGGGPKVVEGKAPNPDVLSALVKLSGGQHYGYDKATWKKWYAATAQVADVNLRRDR